MWPSVRLALGGVLISQAKSGMVWLWVVGLSLPGVSAWPASPSGAAPAAPLAPSLRCVLFEDTLGFVRPVFHLTEVGWLLGSSLGVPQRTPLHRHQHRASTPGKPGPETCQCSELVPPLPFLPVSAVYSARRLAGLLHPAADHGVRLVSSRHPTEAGTDCSHRRRPFEAFPSAVGRKPSLLRASALRSPTSVPLSTLLALAPKCLRPPVLRGLTRRRVRCLGAVLPPCLGSLLPWASSTSSLHSSAPGASRVCSRAAEAACSRGASTASDATAFPRSDLATRTP